MAKKYNFRSNLEDRQVFEQVSLFSKFNSEEIKNFFLAYSYFLRFFLKYNKNLTELPIPYVGKFVKKEDGSYCLEFRKSFLREMDEDLEESLLNFVKSEEFLLLLEDQ